MNYDQQKSERSKEGRRAEKTTGGRTIWRNLIWLVILFAYSFIGGIIFSAIEGKTILNKFSFNFI